ncbi:MAG TPA: ATP-dependent dethiobiotin synthetase BioD [Pseudonocardiaceae bacterium]|jgi:dethiobiotin synthetase
MTGGVPGLAGGPGGILLVTGTGTGVGKTVVVAAIAALAAAAGRRVAVLKPAQTGVAAGQPGDAAEVARLAGIGTARELARYPDPLAPATAARLAGLPPVTPADAVRAARDLARGHDLVLVEGAGGLLVRLADGGGGSGGGSGGASGGDGGGGTLAEVAAALNAPVLVVATAVLGTLNTTALTTEALRSRGLRCAGVVIGSWPDEPDLACRCNLVDLPATCGEQLVGVLPAGAAALERAAFIKLARAALAPSLGGRLDVTRLASMPPAAVQR